MPRPRPPNTIYDAKDEPFPVKIKTKPRIPTNIAINPIFFMAFSLLVIVQVLVKVASLLIGNLPSFLRIHADA
jgi:hypothetical protein